MALNQINKLVWIVESINNSIGGITFEELNSKWIANQDLSNGVDMLKRTFQKWKLKIADTFGLDIECDRSVSPCRYYIRNADDLRHDNNRVEKWLLNTYSVANSLSESKLIKDRIIIDEIPSGREYLGPIIDAMKKSRTVQLSLYSYETKETCEYNVMPLCVKLFRQRWYLVGRSCSTGENIRCCLDRILRLSLTGEPFVYPKDFDPKEYFDGCFGIVTEEGYEIEDVILKVSAGQANYIRALPLMQGDAQQEIERNDSYSIFRVRVRPSFDFQQELLWHREGLEVLEPKWLRKKMAEIVKKMWNKYCKED